MYSVDPQLENRISLNYLVGIQSCFEKFLLELKDQKGFPTYGKPYSASEDKSRLSWTIKHVFSSLSVDKQQLVWVCEYYRLVRNHYVHQSDPDSELRNVYSRLKNIDDGLLCSNIANRLNAPNEIDKICFDDQVLFSRCVRKMAEDLFIEAKYDWHFILEDKMSELQLIAGTVWDCKLKRDKRIKNYLRQTYPISTDDQALQQELDKL